MAEFAALPLFTDSWVADTSHLTIFERGLYMDMLVLCWRSPDCRIPNDPEWIARHLRLTSQEHASLMASIQEFFTIDGEWLFQKRLMKEFNYIRDRHKRLSDGAKSRWGKKNKGQARHVTENETGTSQAYARHIHPSPSPSYKNARTRANGASAAATPNGAAATAPLPIGQDRIRIDFRTDLGRKVQDWFRTHGEICPGNGQDSWWFDTEFLDRVSKAKE